jgi:hypothetical protein
MTIYTVNIKYFSKDKFIFNQKNAYKQFKNYLLDIKILGKPLG